MAFRPRNPLLTWHTLGWILAANLFAMIQITDCSADIGLAEWTIETPGKNHVAHADPLSDRHGVCLHRPAKGGEALDDKVVLVSHIRWWRYFEGHVIGNAKKGFFVLDDKSRQVQYFEDQKSLDHRMKELKLEKPLSKRLVPRDGWKLVWGPVMKGLYQKQLKELKEGRGVAKDLSPAERATLRKSIEQMLKDLDQ